MQIVRLARGGEAVLKRQGHINEAPLLLCVRGRAVIDGCEDETEFNIMFETVLMMRFSVSVSVTVSLSRVRVSVLGVRVSTLARRPSQASSPSMLRNIDSTACKRIQL